MPVSSFEEPKTLLSNNENIRSRHHVALTATTPSNNPPVDSSPIDEEANTEKSYTKKYDKKKRIKIIIAGILIGLFFTFYRFMHNENGAAFLRNFLVHFFDWMEEHTIKGIIAFVLLYALAVSFVMPGTPLIFGSGLVFCQMFSYRTGILIALIAVLCGATLGSVISFSLGRYLLRDWVHRTFSSRYKIIEALNIAMASNNGFRIMCLLHLTPIIPFGPISYMCGTTDMSLMTFALSNIAIIPLAIFYIFIGASMNRFILSLNEALKGRGQDAEMYHFVFMLGGIFVSAASISYISHVVKKELNKIIEKNKKVTLQEQVES